MTYGEMIQSIMPLVREGSELPFIVRRNPDDWNWEIDFVTLSSEKAEDYLNAIKDNSDSFAVMLTGKDFANGSYSYVYDSVLLARLREECDREQSIDDYKQRWNGSPQDVYSAFSEQVTELSPEAAECLADFVHPLIRLNELYAAYSQTDGSQSEIEFINEQLCKYAEARSIVSPRSDNPLSFEEYIESFERDRTDAPHVYGGVNPRELYETYLEGFYEMQKLQTILDRIELHYQNYLQSLRGFSADKLINMSGEIAAMSDAHFYLSDGVDLSDDDIETLSMFVNPLQAVADAWYARCSDISDISFALEHVIEHKDEYLAEDALYAAKKTQQQESPPEPPLYERFVNGGSECFVLERVGNEALVWMPANRATPYVVAHGYAIGSTEWDSGSYFSSLGTAANEFTDLLRSHEPLPSQMRIAGGDVTAQDVFAELTKRLEYAGRLPDEYFILSADWSNGRLFPKDAEVICDVDWGGSEGIYVDVGLRYDRSGQTITEHFATGKTLGETDKDMDKMYLVASAIKQEFDGDIVHSRWVAIDAPAERTSSFAAELDAIVAAVRTPGEKPGTSEYDIRSAIKQMSDKYGAEHICELLESIRGDKDLKTKPVVLNALITEARNTLRKDTMSKEENREI